MLVGFIYIRSKSGLCYLTISYIPYTLLQLSPSG